MADAVLEPAGATAPPSIEPPASGQVCRNCGVHVAGHYCANCGQETRIALPTFGAFMRDAAGRYVALDGRLWRTLLGLVARPGFLTLEYFAGRRRRYIRPARLFLVLYLLLFAVIGLLQSPTDLADEVVFADSETAEAAKSTAPASAERKTSRNSSAKEPPAKETPVKETPVKETPVKETPAKGLVVFDSEDESLFGLDKDLNVTLRIVNTDLPIPAQVRKRYEHFRKLPKEEKAEQLYAGVLRFGPYAMVVLLPAFALLLKLAYLGSGSRYPGRPGRYAEHLVYSAHLHAFAALAILLILLLPFAPLRYAIAAWIVFYVMRARQVVYRGRWWAGLLRGSAIAIVYTVLMAVAMAGLLTMAVMLR